MHWCNGSEQKRIIKRSMKAIYDTLASLPSDSMHHVPASCVYSRFGRIRSVSVESIRCKRAAPQLRRSWLLLLRPLDEDFDNDVEKDEEDVDPSLRRVRIVLLRPPPNEDSPFLMCCMDEDNRFKNPLPIVVLALVFFYRTGNNLEWWTDGLMMDGSFDFMLMKLIRLIERGYAAFVFILLTGNLRSIRNCEFMFLNNYDLLWYDDMIYDALRNT